ncbi:MAG: hypothetical protein AAGH15_23780, partial [Myxococcota bacterium]
MRFRVVDALGVPIAGRPAALRVGEAVVRGVTDARGELALGLGRGAVDADARVSATAVRPGGSGIVVRGSWHERLGDIGERASDGSWVFEHLADRRAFPSPASLDVRLAGVRAGESLRLVVPGGGTLEVPAGEPGPVALELAWRENGTPLLVGVATDTTAGTVRGAVAAFDVPAANGSVQVRLDFEADAVPMRDADAPTVEGT